MNAEADAFAENAAAYALGALDESDRDEFELHLESCETCNRLVDEFRGTAAMLPYGLPLSRPPEGAGTQLLAAARARVPVAATPVRRPHFRWPQWQTLRWAAVGLVIAGLAIWNISLRGGESADAPYVVTYTRVVDLVGTGAPGSSARLYIAPDAQTAQLQVQGLDQLPSDRVYQLWFAGPGLPTTAGGSFRVSADGSALANVVVPLPLDQVAAVAVSQEPSPGSLTNPTGAHLLEGATR